MKQKMQTLFLILFSVPVERDTKGPWAIFWEALFVERYPPLNPSCADVSLGGSKFGPHVPSAYHAPHLQNIHQSGHLIPSINSMVLILLSRSVYEWLGFSV